MDILQYPFHSPGKCNRLCPDPLLLDKGVDVASSQIHKHSYHQELYMMRSYTRFLTNLAIESAGFDEKDIVIVYLVLILVSEQFRVVEVLKPGYLSPEERLKRECGVFEPY